MSGKKAIIIVFFVFLSPLLLAQLVLKMGWYTKGVTNHGDLIEPPTHLRWLPHQGQWRLLYSMPSACNDQCDNAMFQLNQIPQAIGRETDRVASVVLLKNTNQFKKPFISYQQPNAKQWQEFNQLPFKPETIYLVDPLNQIVLAYPIPKEKTARVKQSKGLMRDLKKLMKLSKVG